MKASFRRNGFELAVALIVTFALFALPAAASKDASQKDLVGNWEGTFTMGSGSINIGMTLRMEDKKVVGELRTPHGPWTVTEAKYSEGKWEILVRTPENGGGRLTGVLNGDKLEGSYEFPPSFGGDFKMTRVKDAK